MNNLPVYPEVVDLDEFFKSITSVYSINEVEIESSDLDLEYFQLMGIRSPYHPQINPQITKIKIKTESVGWSWDLASFEFYGKKDNIATKDLIGLRYIHNFSSGQVLEVVEKYIWPHMIPSRS